MKATIIITDDKGNTWQADLPLRQSEPRDKRAHATESRKRPAQKAKQPAAPAPLQDADLTLPLRTFMNRFAQGLPGHGKFTLLVAHLSGGDLKKEIPAGEIEKQWNKMRGLLCGSFNSAYTTRAKDKGWVDSSKPGTYNLLPDWEGALADG
ncbi:MAG: hypothetical protein WAL34_15105 [Acidobacteriaceae bacterium]